MSETTLYKLVNPSFTFEFGNKTFEVKKANLEKAVQYQKRYQELMKSGNIEQQSLELVAYSIYLVLKDKDESITIEWVKDNTPADIDVLECLATLGFIKPKQMEAAKSLQEKIVEKLITPDSSAS
jgi:hypothetical protein